MWRIVSVSGCRGRPWRSVFIGLTHWGKCSGVGWGVGGWGVGVASGRGSGHKVEFLLLFVLALVLVHSVASLNVNVRGGGGRGRLRFECNDYIFFVVRSSSSSVCLYCIVCFAATRVKLS